MRTKNKKNFIFVTDYANEKLSFELCNFKIRKNLPQIEFDLPEIVLDSKPEVLFC